MAPVRSQRRFDDEETRVAKRRIVPGVHAKVRFTCAPAHATHRRDGSIAVGDKKQRLDRARAEIATVAITAGDLSPTHHHVVGAVAIFHHQPVVAEGALFPQGAGIEAFTLAVQSFLFTSADPGADSNTRDQKDRKTGSEIQGDMLLHHHIPQCIAKVTDR